MDFLIPFNDMVPGSFEVSSIYTLSSYNIIVEQMRIDQSEVQLKCGISGSGYMMNMALLSDKTYFLGDPTEVNTFSG